MQQSRMRGKITTFYVLRYKLAHKYDEFAISVYQNIAFVDFRSSFAAPLRRRALAKSA